MFTGIIEKQAKIITANNGLFEVENNFGDEIILGQSIAHDGACMTITEFNSDTYSFFVMQESLDKTNFGKKQAGDFFNIERCLKIGDRLDGHFVSGHIDVTGTVEKLENIADESLAITISFPKDFQRNIIYKGSITVNGVSLTVVSVENNSFTIHIIPYTQEHTNLGKFNIGDTVNLEFDMVGKYILNK